MEVHGLRLIEEVRKRPKLWVKKRKKNMDKLWAEVGQVLETDASLCKRTWQIMRIRFWVETKRILIRIAKAKEKGTYNPKNKYTSWHLFDTLKFLELIKSGHRKYHSVSEKSDIEIVERKSSHQTNNAKQKCMENKTLPNYNADQIIAIDESDESESDIKKMYSYQLNSPESEFATIAKENTAHRNNTVFKEEPELQIEAEMNLTENENISEFKRNKFSTCSTHEPSHCFVKAFVKDEIPDQSMATEEYDLKPPDITDENYSFLYSFLSQTKLMSQSLKMEFRIKMKNLLLYIFPASSSVDILENQLLLAVDDDPDKKFLMSFWPFMKSMSLRQNLLFRAKMADLLLNSLSPKWKGNSI